MRGLDFLVVIFVMSSNYVVSIPHDEGCFLRLNALFIALLLFALIGNINMPFHAIICILPNVPYSVIPFVLLGVICEIMVICITDIIVCILYRVPITLLHNKERFVFIICNHVYILNNLPPIVLHTILFCLKIRCSMLLFDGYTDFQLVLYYWYAMMKFIT